MKITKKWLNTHKWMLRSSNNGKSYQGFQWPEIGVWINCPDWDEKPECGHGFHGETEDYHGFYMQYTRPELVEYEGVAIPIDNNKVKVRRARIVATGIDIPKEVFMACGYKIAKDGDTISPKIGENWIVLKGTITVTNQTGGDCRFWGNSRQMAGNRKENKK